MNTFLIELIKRWIRVIQTGNNKKTILFILAGIVTVLSFLVPGVASNTTGISEEGSIWFYLGVFLKLIGILMLIVGGSVLFRRWQAKLPGRKSLRQLAVVESVRLSPRQTLHLIQAGSQQLVIGATDQGIALISEIKPVKSPGIETMEDTKIDFPDIFHRIVSSPSIIETSEMNRP